MPTNEAGVVASIRRAISTRYPDSWALKVAGNSFQASGTPDLLVVVDGLLFGLEVKYQRPGESHAAAVARCSPNQQIQILRLRGAGAVADVVTAPEEALALIEARLRGKCFQPMCWKRVEDGIPQVGDIAVHKGGERDYHKVVAIIEDEDGTPEAIMLGVGTTAFGPFDVSNYTYERKVG